MDLIQKKPTLYKNLIQFGRIGYVTIRTPHNKLDVKAVKCVMIGYSKNYSGDMYWMFNGTMGKVIQSQDVNVQNGMEKANQLMI